MSRTEALLRWTFAADERLDWDFEVVLDYLDEVRGEEARGRRSHTPPQLPPAAPLASLVGL